MQEEIKAIIEKNLPAQVGETLKQVLDKGERDAKELDSLKEINQKNVNEIRRLEEVISNYRALDARNSALESREKAASEKEAKFEADQLKYQLQSEKEKTEFVKDVALGLVRNINYRKRVFDSENQEGYYKDNVWVQPTPTNKHLDETNTAD